MSILNKSCPIILKLFTESTVINCYLSVILKTPVEFGSYYSLFFSSRCNIECKTESALPSYIIFFIALNQNKLLKNSNLRSCQTETTKKVHLNTRHIIANKFTTFHFSLTLWPSAHTPIFTACLPTCTFVFIRH